MMATRNERMALLLSSVSFEGFYGDVMHLTCEEYVRSYRHDFSFLLANTLAAREIDVVIYIPAWACRGLHQLDKGIYVRFLPLAPWFRPWSKFRVLWKTPMGRYMSQYANTRAFEEPLKRALEEDKVTALYIQEYWTARFDRLARVLSVPIIGADQGGTRTRQLTFRKRKAFQLASAIVCQTENECSQVRAFGKEPVLLTNGIDTSFYSPSTEVPRAQTVLIVARLTDRQKRVSDLIRAVLHLPDSWSLQIAGSGPDEASLRALAAEIGVSGRTNFLGFISDKGRLRNMYRECGVYCMPSAYEGLPLAILEAMSCGCSVVVTSIRAFDGLVEDDITGYKVPVGEPAQLAMGITKAWNEHERIGVAARNAVNKRYSLESMADRMQMLIRGARNAK